MNNIKTKIEENLSKIVLVFMILQPVLDVISYFLSQIGSNTLSTLARFGMLALVALLGFIVSDKKKLYIGFYSVLIIFWLCHMLNCFRIGYSSVFKDFANFLRIASLPIYTLSFITFFNKGKNIRKSVYMGFGINMLIVIVFTVIPWLLGDPQYTYETLGVGVSGWFSIKSAQSAIIALLTPITILFAFKTKKYILYLLAVVLTTSLLFMTGTKLTFYCIFLILLAFIVLFVINLKMDSVKYIIPLAILMIATAAFRTESPMQVRENMSASTQNTYAALVSQSISDNTKDEDVLETIKSGDVSKATKKSTVTLTKIRKSLIGVYTDREVYGAIFEDLNDRFGVYNVMKAYNYTTNTSILSDSREKKSIYAELMWDEKDILTKLFGFEYNDMVYKDAIYDLENDFPAVFYFCGYIGFAMYILYFAAFVFIVIKSLLRNISKFLTIEMGVVGMSFILALGAAQISGNVLRRPNVTAYFAIIAATLYHLSVNKANEKIPLKTQFENFKSSIKLPKIRKKKTT